MNSTSVTPTNSLTVIQNLVTQYTFTVLFIVGNFTNVANLIVFLQKNLRTNACSWYFILLSIGHLGFFYSGCLTRIIAAWSGFDLNRFSIIYCRARIYFLSLSLLIARYFLCFIAIDRWMVTSTNASLRRLSSLKVARWCIIYGSSFCVLFCIIMPIWYQIEANRGCVAAANTFFPLFFTIYNLILTIAPILIMVLFSLLALENLRRARVRNFVSSTGTNTINQLAINSRSYHRRDIQFIKLSLMQVIAYILCTSFYAYTATYAFVSQSWIKSREQAALDSFLNTIAINISYLYMAITFFLYTMVSKTFRTECRAAIKRFFRC